MCVALSRAQGGWAIKTVQQWEHSKITASNLVSSKSVKRLLALLVAHDFLMDTDGNRIREHSEHAVECVSDFSRGNLQCTLGHGRSRHNKGFAFERDTCGVVVTHTTFLCILLACFD